MVKKNPDFRFNRKRKSGKTEFFEVHIERAVITHSMTALFVAFRTFLATCAHYQPQIELYSSHAVLLAWIFSCLIVQRHERTHNSDKPFSCPKCDYKCSTSSDLKRHERTHTGDKPFSCSQCDYKYLTSSDLKSHK